jgi:hypothetical protein
MERHRSGDASGSFGEPSEEQRGEEDREAGGVKADCEVGERKDG